MRPCDHGCIWKDSGRSGPWGAPFPLWTSGLESCDYLRSSFKLFAPASGVAKVTFHLESIPPRSFELSLFYLLLRVRTSCSLSADTCELRCACFAISDHDLAVCKGLEASMSYRCKSRIKGERTAMPMAASTRVLHNIAGWRESRSDFNVSDTPRTRVTCDMECTNCQDEEA